MQELGTSQAILGTFILSMMRYILLPLHEPLLEVCVQLTGMQLHLLADLGAGRFVL